MKNLGTKNLRALGIARTTLVGALALGLLAPLGAAQDEAPPQEDERPQDDGPKRPEETPEDINPFDRPGPAGNPQAEMAELFVKVDKRLQRVSELLFEASTGDASRANDIGSSGIDELIRAAEAASGASTAGIAQLLEATKLQSEQAKQEIDRILEIAKENQQPSSGGGSPNSPPQQGDPMPQQGQTPSGSKKEEGERADSSQPHSQEQNGQEPKDADNPNSPEDHRGGQDGVGKNPPTSELGDAADAAGNEEWGDLPVHLRKVFQNGVSDDVPPRYRDWVDAYYKRLNRRGGR